MDSSNMLGLFFMGILAVGCSDNAIEKLPDNGGNGDSGKPSVVTQSTDWAALADSCSYVLVENFLDKSKGTFWSTPRDLEHASSNIYWQQAHAIDVLLYQYVRIKEKSPNLADTYRTYFERWYANGANNYNKSRWDDGVHGRFFNQWTDDMAWICLTLLHMSEVLGDGKFADTARAVYDNYIWPRATDTGKGISLPWTDRAEDAGNKNACTNAPSCLVAAKLHLRYGQEGYRKQAISLHDFCIAGMPDHERVEEPPLTYTQGTFGEACRVLYHITGERSFLDKAGVVLAYAFTGNRCIDSSTGVLRDEGPSMDQTIFKAVYIPYAVNYVLDGSAPEQTRRLLRDKLLLCGKVLSKNLDRRLFPQMYCGPSWVKPFDSGVASMGAQASGASLMEGLARLPLSP